jgi:hypothetical protein
MDDETGRAEARGLSEIARALDEAASELRRHARGRPEPAWPPLPPPPGEPPTAAQVRALIGARRLRLAYLPDLQGDHGFAMLLELYAAHLEGRRISQTRLGSLAGAPQATAIRIVHALLEAGLIDRSDDPADRRLILLALTPDAAERMEAYLTRAFAANALLL